MSGSRTQWTFSDEERWPTPAEAVAAIQEDLNQIQSDAPVEIIRKSFEGIRIVAEAAVERVDGVCSDAAFHRLSPMARLLLLSLPAAADANGVFTWTPWPLKRRLLPCDNADINALLGELEAGDFIRRYEVDGILYGAIRNGGDR